MSWCKEPQKKHKSAQKKKKLVKKTCEGAKPARATPPRGKGRKGGPPTWSRKPNVPGDREGKHWGWSIT